MNTTIVMHSGGLDSTYALHYYLTRTDDKVVAHHINFRHSNTLESVAETRAVEALMKEFRKPPYRAFSASQSTIDCYKLDSKDQSEYQMFIGWQLAKQIAPFVDGKVRLGFGWYFAGPVSSYYVRKAAEGVYGEPRRLWKAYIRATPQSIRDKLDTRLLQPFRKLTKAEFAKELPENIKKAVWSCTLPVKYGAGLVPCGICTKCAELREAMNASF